MGKMPMLRVRLLGLPQSPNPPSNAGRAPAPAERNGKPCGCYFSSVAGSRFRASTSLK
jgi:hypothetical protein